MERPEIYQQLTDMIPELKRRMATPRVLAPVDVLLDQLIELNKVDAQVAAIEAQFVQ